MPTESNAFEVTCPCCSAVLKVDSGAQAVIAHTAAAAP
jgi:ribosomal protein S27E